ncbi:hypothetical protein [Halothece sp. PCC 7418]|uniref:hypothetical protein n=1 Tax=Halothece sp. (strain PCC 7418) TaxID=65093 RepID=UPI00031B23FC|nr:hypothetical protein [Halothece sp. PCC 7418]
MSEPTDLIIHHAEILYPDGHLEKGDVAIAQGNRQEIASEIDRHASEEINGKGLTLLPGVSSPLLDPYVATINGFHINFHLV